MFKILTSRVLANNENFSSWLCPQPEKIKLSLKASVHFCGKRGAASGKTHRTRRHSHALDSHWRQAAEARGRGNVPFLVAYCSYSLSRVLSAL